MKQNANAQTTTASMHQKFPPAVFSEKTIPPNRHFEVFIIFVESQARITCAVDMQDADLARQFLKTTGT